MSLAQLALLFDELADQVPDSAKACLEVPDSPPLHEDDAADNKPKKKGKKKRRGRQPLPKDLPCETQVVRVPDEERVCPVCGKDKQVIGHRVSEVLDRDHPKGVKRGHMWCHVGDTTWVAFRYAPSWEAKHPALLLRRFEGFIQVDDYKGYAARVDGPGGKTPLVDPERRLGCGMHIRRRFEQAAKGGDVRGGVALAYFRRIYDIEASCKADGLGPDARLARRRSLSLPVLAELDQWVDEIHPGLVPDTTLEKATRYAIAQRPFFSRCFTDGRFEIDNGEVERQIRRVALGRKNYLFAGSDSAAERIADAYTVLGTCHLHGVDPQAYLTDVIVKLQGGWPQSRVDELLPPQWDEARKANLADEHADEQAEAES